MNSDHLDLTGDPIEGVVSQTVFQNSFVMFQSHSIADKTFHSIAPASGGGSVMLAVDSQNRIALVRQERPAVRRHTWEAPRGGREAGEKPIDTAIRELYEETGIAADPSSVTSLGRIEADTGLVSAELWLFCARVEDGELGSFEDDRGEIDIARWFSAGRVVDACLSGEITDAFTVIAVLKAKVLGLLDN